MSEALLVIGGLSLALNAFIVAIVTRAAGDLEDLRATAKSNRLDLSAMRREHELGKGLR